MSAFTREQVTMADRRHAPRGAAFHNPAPGPIPEGAPRNMVKAEFGNRLHRHIMLAGMNQSEFAVAATKHMPVGKKIGRDSISSYVRGKQLPGPVHLKAMCDALGVERDDLLPARGVPSTAKALPHLEVKDIGDGMGLFQCNQMLPWTKIMRLMTIIKESEANEHDKEG